MKKLITTVIITLTIGISLLSTKAEAQPVGYGLGNQCEIPAVNNWCWIANLPLGTLCYCDATGYAPGYVF